MIATMQMQWFLCATLLIAARPVSTHLKLPLQRAAVNIDAEGALFQDAAPSQSSLALDADEQHAWAMRRQFTVENHSGTSDPPASGRSWLISCINGYFQKLVARSSTDGNRFVQGFSSFLPSMLAPAPTEKQMYVDETLNREALKQKFISPWSINISRLKPLIEGYRDPKEAQEGADNTSGNVTLDPVTLEAARISKGVKDKLFPSTDGNMEHLWSHSSGSDIWKERTTWVSIQRPSSHPVGVVSNVNGGIVSWRDVSYISYKMLLLVTVISYPAFLLIIVMTCTVLVSVCLTQDDTGDGVDKTSDNGRLVADADGHSADTRCDSEEECSDCDAQETPELVQCRRTSTSLKPVAHREVLLPVHRLSPLSKKMYGVWQLACRAIPGAFVFGVPFVLLLISWPYPQEVCVALMLLTAGLVISSGLYMVVFAGSGVIKMSRAMETDYEFAPGVMHWVILPQYKEDIEHVSMALRSICRSASAKSSIAVCLAMEVREDGSKEKAMQLKKAFRDDFREIFVSLHPQDLPNDPPGKASNVAWAFKKLTEHMQMQGAATSRTILTVADADSEFHDKYFDALGESYLGMADAKRDLVLWQSPIFHVKNYHRQPCLVVPGSVVTCIGELAVLNDPNAVRFPYSTYSLSMDLAIRVGGWDQEWIAEDWHMGIKCFLYTYGGVTVEPILLPTVNYTPEEASWSSTLAARWSQAKRHALGFSDLTYFFMMLPLMYGQARSNEELKGFWRTLFFGLTLVIKFVNVHVFLGICVTYGFGTLMLQAAMLLVISPDNLPMPLLYHMKLCGHLFFTSSAICTCVISTLFVIVYDHVKTKIEGPPLTWKFIHWLSTVGTLIFTCPVYFSALGIAVWKAAVSVMVSKTFVYEVAAKPPPYLLAKTRLDQYCASVCDALAQHQGSITTPDVEKLGAATRKVQDWMNGTQCEKKDEYEQMQKWLEGVVIEVGTTPQGCLFMERLAA